ncbi:hypothetical protein GQS52_12050 [Streptomyces sp. SCUT-3]|uniref:hypothetical protein n=1 Tax=Streptomyces sp. SCUT-3 TaxID=2684469 RepID=UPI0015FA85ED|nr:hypothetical protein [Streptomyces sp. SCUT-3]QMV22402.1 hypothetical protein GQS52_12050 [Streptomyces sp. SCUT-3]
MTGREAGTVPLAALPMPDRTSWIILVGLLVAVVALLWWCGRVVRRQGGLRRAMRRARWEARTTGRAVTRPWRTMRRDRRRTRTLTAFLAAPDARSTAADALDRADRDAAGPCRAVAVSLTPARDRVRVLLAGRDVPAPPAPWSAAEATGPWTWAAPLGKDGSVAGGIPETEAEAEAEAGQRLPLVLGVDRHGSGGVVVADWCAGPPVVTVEGDGPAARSVLQALTAQLDALPEGPQVLVAGGVHARFAGRPLPELLERLERLEQPGAADGGFEPPVLVCWAPDAADAARLCALAERGAARVLAGGAALPGSAWALHVEADGRLLAPELGADVEAAALSRAVARALRAAARGGRRPPQPPRPPRPSAGTAAPAGTAAAPEPAASPASAGTAATDPARTPDRDRTPQTPQTPQALPPLRTSPDLTEPAPATGRAPGAGDGRPAREAPAADLVEPEPVPPAGSGRGPQQAPHAKAARDVAPAARTGTAGSPAEAPAETSAATGRTPADGPAALAEPGPAPAAGNGPVAEQAPPAGRVPAARDGGSGAVPAVGHEPGDEPGHEPGHGQAPPPPASGAAVGAGPRAGTGAGGAGGAGDFDEPEPAPSPAGSGVSAQPERSERHP